MEPTKLRGKAYKRWLEEKRRQRVKIKAAYQREHSLSVVAEMFGLTRSRVSQIVNHPD